MSFSTIFVTAVLLISVKICWNIVATTVQRRTVCISRLNWLTLYLLVVHHGRGALISPTAAGQAYAAEGSWNCCCYVLLPNISAKESPGVVRLEENTLPVAILGTLCDSFAPLRWRACSLDSWRDGVSLRPPNCHCSVSVSMLCCPFPGNSLCRWPPPITHNKQDAWS
jgi:hypothetical protein